MALPYNTKHTKKFIFNIPDFLRQKVTREASSRLLSDGDIVREALVKYFQEKEKGNESNAQS